MRVEYAEAEITYVCVWEAPIDYNKQHSCKTKM